MTRARRMSWVTFALVAVFALVVACTPGQREAVRVGVPVVTRAACVLLHALAQDGTTDTLCATAEDLAPLVTTILAERAEHPERQELAADAGPGKVNLSFVVLEPVAELPAPARRVPRRKCVAWVPVVPRDASLGPQRSEGGTDAAPE